MKGAGGGFIPLSFTVKLLRQRGRKPSSCPAAFQVHPLGETRGTGFPGKEAAVPCCALPPGLTHPSLGCNWASLSSSLTFGVQGHVLKVQPRLLWFATQLLRGCLQAVRDTRSLCGGGGRMGEKCA